MHPAVCVNNIIHSALPKILLCSQNISVYTWDNSEQSPVTMSGHIPCDLSSYVYAFSRLKGNHSSGVCSHIGNKHYLPMIDFTANMFANTLTTEFFWKDISALYPGEKLYVFDTGTNKQHGYLSNVFDEHGHEIWLEFLTNHKDTVNQSWVSRASRNTHGGILRWTPKSMRAIVLNKWVNL